MKAEHGSKKGLWTQEEDMILIEYVRVHGRGHWNRIPNVTGLKRCGKSCRLRWLNYLSPSVKHGDFSQEEEDLIIRLHNLLGNRWSLIAGRVPGRTDNQVKNHWNTHLRKKFGNKKQKKGVVSSSRTHSTHIEDHSGRVLGESETLSFEHLRDGEMAENQDHPAEISIGEVDSLYQQRNESLLIPSTDYHLNLFSPGLFGFLDGYCSLDDLIWQN
ncbi:hypothetical protein Ddye_031275 [Dipteronia dyeriana]|uniref:Uncharacterized protein n=1 Tax=Dipteronia dyeriana TaxID=168575 RepID=A0AAD9WNI8_9ROSI|nr:hypothetical protein Ddye_031275 [Dipteronia dyeriana]